MKDKIKIVTVCSMGLGTSILAKMAIENVIKDTDFNVSIDCADIGSAAGYDADVYVTTKELFKAFNPPEGAKVVIVTNFLDEEEMKKNLLPVLKEF